MGRLFWKFFAYFWLAQLVTMLGVGVVVWIKTANDADRQLAGFPHPPNFVLLDSAANTLQFGGREAFSKLASAWKIDGKPEILVLDRSGHDILGRAVESDASSIVLDAQQSPPHGPQSIKAPFQPKRIVTINNEPYVLVANSKDMNRPPPFPPQNHWRLLPIEPMIAGAFVCLAFAALLAWNLSRPIRALRAAFAAASGGKMSLRLAPSMGRRRDEFAEVGREFDHMAEKIEGLMDGQRRLLHDVSHELRSPLARLQAAVGLARQQPERFNDTLDRIERESLRMNTLIDELLTLSRLEAGISAELNEPVPMIELIEQIAADARFEAEACGRQLHFERCDEIEVIGNAELLHRAIENVVRNAIAYSPAGSSIEIQAELRADSNLYLSIEDQGPGIPADKLPFIFEPFFRGPGTQGKQGHGLGLAIAHSIVEAHHGSIAASNLAAGGLCVRIALPTMRKLGTANTRT